MAAVLVAVEAVALGPLVARAPLRLERKAEGNRAQFQVLRSFALRPALAAFLQLL